METGARSIHIFCGYAHEDKPLFNQLHEHLAVLRSEEYITLWHYGEILPGAEWESAITYHLDQADLILLLISPSFMHSEYCRGKEMRRAIERHKTGEVHVLPILLRPTPAWEATVLGSLQALPRQAKPVTTWRNRDEAFANITEGIIKVIQQAQQEEKYPIQAYGLAFDYYTYMGVQQEELVELEKAMRQKAEHWLVAIQETGGTLQEVDPEIGWVDQLFTWKKWLFRLRQQDAYIHMRTKKQLYAADYAYEPIYLRVTTSHFDLLDHFVKLGRLPYKTLQWTLPKELNLTGLLTHIYEQTGKLPFSPTDIYRSTPTSIEYRIFDESKQHGVKVSFSSQTSRSLARIRLTRDTTMDGSFYRAHQLFSIRTILSILQGEIPFKQVAQLVEDACSPPEEIGEEE